MAKIEKTVKIFCFSCKSITNHEIYFEKGVSGYNEENDIRWWEKYQLVICRGCDNVSYRTVTSSSEDFDPNTGQQIEYESLYPERKSGRTSIDEIYSLPAKTRKIYNETLKALNSNLLILSTIGLRGLIESICLDQKVPGRNLEQKIKALAKNGLLSEKQAEILHTHRFLGNEAAHQIEAPKPSELTAAFDIAEILLKTIYVIPELNESIKKRKS